jgi:tetratricopeptide (TPR) repeat protein
VRSTTSVARRVLGLAVLLCKLAVGSGCESTTPWQTAWSAAQRSFAAGDWPGLEATARELVNACPASGKGYYWDGVAWFKQMRFFFAVRSLRRSLEMQDDASGHLALAQAYAALNQTEFFREELAAAKRLNPANPESQYVEGKFAFEHLYRLDLAEAALRRCLELRSDHYQATCLLGLCYRLTGRMAEAEKALLIADGVAARNPHDAQAARLLTELYLETSRPQEALECARRAAAVDPASAAGQYLLGKAEWSLKNAPAAAVALQKAISLEADDPQFRFLLAEVYRAMSKPEAAARELARYVELEELYGRR